PARAPRGGSGAAALLAPRALREAAEAPPRGRRRDPLVFDPAAALVAVEELEQVLRGRVLGAERGRAGKFARLEHARHRLRAGRRRRPVEDVPPVPAEA